MNFLMTSLSDVGISRKNNQDALYTSVVSTESGRASFSVICDGMGGLSEGEVASNTIAKAFNEWSVRVLPKLLTNQISFEELKLQWECIIMEQNRVLIDYGIDKGINLGTTLSCLLIANGNYFIVHIGDCRVYELTDALYQLTTDHTIVARDVRLGNLSPEQAKNDPRSNILLQCIGASNSIEPEFILGEAKKDAVYLLCTDGFRHKISDDEIYANLNSFVLFNEDVMYEKARYLVELCKERQEKDNISLILVRPF